MSAVPQATGWQAGFLQVLPVIQTHAKIQFRKLSAVHREEAVQEAVCNACVSYHALAARGRLDAAPPGMIAEFAVKFVRNGRHVGSRQDTAKDVLSPVCQRRHGVLVYSADLRREERDSNDWKKLVIADRKASIADTAAFRIDFAEWLATLQQRDQWIIAALVAGEPGWMVADRFDITEGRVSQLRRRYEWLWQRFQGDAVGECKRAA